MQDSRDAQRLADLRQELDQLKRSLPAHSLQPSLLIHIEELEEQIEMLSAQEVPESRPKNERPA